MKQAPPPELDTITWLLTTEGCAYCGDPEAVLAGKCPGCGRSQLLLVRPQQRSMALSSLIGLWTLGAAVAALLAIGAWLQLSGRMPLQSAPSNSQIMRSLAKIVGVEALDTPIKAVPPPAWFLPSMIMLFLLAAIMAWSMAARQAWAFYVGLILSATPALLGIVITLQLRGFPALAALIGGILISTLFALLQLATSKHMLGEHRRINSAPPANSATSLYRAGIEQIRQGMLYLGARQMARVLGKEPSNSDALQVLALALEQLGLPERAQATRRRIS